MNSVPLLVEGIFNRDRLTQYAQELAEHAVVFAVQEKNRPTQYATTEPLALPVSLAVKRLLDGLARCVQIRYAFAEQEWIDTILAVGTGYRVVRCPIPENLP